MKILVTGASSYVGAKIYTDLKDKFEIIGTYNSNKFFDELIHLDITQENKINKVIKHIKPDYIIHVASNPFPKWCDKNPELAIKINQVGTQNIVNAANLIDAKLIFISTFSVTADKGIYADTKRASEQIIKQVKAGYVSIRLSLVFGYSPNKVNDRTFNRLINNIIKGNNLPQDTSWKFKPTWLKHVSESIEYIINHKILNETIPVAVQDLKSRFEVSRDILSPFNIKIESQNQNSNAPFFDESLDKMKELGLPEYTYDEMIEGIIKEVKENFINK
jgi:dTDP-4-dehydrorhamnose reductase